MSSHDVPGQGISRPRPIKRRWVPPGPARELIYTLHDQYLQAGAPTLTSIEAAIAGMRNTTRTRLGADDDVLDDLAGAEPDHTTIGRIIGAEAVPPRRENVVAVALALSSLAGQLSATATADDLRELANRWRERWRKASVRPSVQAGTSVGDCTWTDLEVHPAIVVPGEDLHDLPAFVARRHDQQLAEIVAAVNTRTARQSRVVTLVGGSSTGKTRSAWEAINGLGGKWRVWQPIGAEPATVLLRDLDRVGPHTVVWLNDAHDLLLAEAGERICGDLRSLIGDRERAPILVIVTLWHDPWTTLTATSESGGPVSRQAYALLVGTEIVVPETFDVDDLEELHVQSVADPRLRLAGARAQDRRITQYLAGAPEIERRYATAPPGARAVMDSAIDARSLGHPARIGRDFLSRAAPGYLSEQAWQQTQAAAEARRRADPALGDWLDQALEYAGAFCLGVPGPLAVLPARFARGESEAGQAHYVVADILEQVVGKQRHGLLVPASLWQAAAETLTDPQALSDFAMEAEARARLPHAVRLYQQAADCGLALALWDVARLLKRAGDEVGSDAAVQQAEARGADGSLPDILVLREWAEFGSSAAAGTWDERAPDGTLDLREQARAAERAGDPGRAEAIAWEAFDRGDTRPLRDLASIREGAGNIAGAQDLLREATDRGDGYAWQDWAVLRERCGDTAGADDIAGRAARAGRLDPLFALADMRTKAGRNREAEVLLWGAAHAHPGVLVALAELQLTSGNVTQAEELLRRAADHGVAGALRAHARLREQQEDLAGASDLLTRAAARSDIRAWRDRAVWRDLARLKAQTGDTAAAEELLRQAAAEEDTAAFRQWAELRAADGDLAGAAEMFQQAINRGDADAVPALAALWQHSSDAADVARADRLLRFGIGDDGLPPGPWSST